MFLGPLYKYVVAQTISQTHTAAEYAIQQPEHIHATDAQLTRRQNAKVARPAAASATATVAVAATAVAVAAHTTAAWALPTNQTTNQPSSQLVSCPAPSPCHRRRHVKQPSIALNNHQQES